LSDEDSSNREYDHGDPLPSLTEGEIAKALIQLSLVGRALMQFDDIITMNAPHHTKFEHAYVLDVHFSKTTIESDVTAAPAK